VFDRNYAHDGLFLERRPIPGMELARLRAGTRMRRSHPVKPSLYQAIARLLPTLAAGLLVSACATTANTQNAAPYRGIGYATVSVQPGKTLAQRQLMAIRASRLAAMRELAEKIHGMNIDSYTSVSEGAVQNDTLRGSVVGLMRSARTVSINPSRGNTVYETILEVDAADVEDMRLNHKPILYR
jgi:hypothetical protein